MPACMNPQPTTSATENVIANLIRSIFNQDGRGMLVKLAPCGLGQYASSSQQAYHPDSCHLPRVRQSHSSSALQHQLNRIRSHPEMTTLDFSSLKCCCSQILSKRQIKKSLLQHQLVFQKQYQMLNQSPLDSRRKRRLQSFHRKHRVQLLGFRLC